MPSATILSTYQHSIPFKLVFIKQVDFSENLTRRVDLVYNIDVYEQEVRYRLQDIKKYIEKAKIKRKFKFDSALKWN